MLLVAGFDFVGGPMLLGLVSMVALMVRWAAAAALCVDVFGVCVVVCEGRSA